MPVTIAFMIVVLIWGTTPLAIYWSNSDAGFILAVTLRMALALMVGLLIHLCLGRSLFRHAGAWKVYLVASIGIFPAMPVVYWSAQFIPSGLVAVIFSISPFVTGAMSWLILKENPFNRRSIVALILAVCGLMLIFTSKLPSGLYSIIGILGVVFACSVFSFSSVMLKKMNAGIDAFEQTVGSLLFAVPSLLLTWWFLGGQWPPTLSVKSGTAIGYLAIVGSLLGFTLFFYVLNHMKPTTVSLSTLITPLIALSVGVVFANEVLTVKIVAGVTVVITSLAIYLGIFPWRQKHRNIKI